MNVEISPFPQSPFHVTEIIIICDAGRSRPTTLYRRTFSYVTSYALQEMCVKLV